jgi:O-antigen/teichoic acid export membrane protein
MTSLAINIKQLYSAQRDRIWKYRNELRSMSALAGSNFISAILGALGGLLVAVYLGPEETGLFRYFTIPLMYLTFLHLGTFDGLYRQIPFYYGQNRADDINKIASASGAWNVFVTVIVSIIFVLLSLDSFFMKDTPAVYGWLTQVFVCWGNFYGGYLGATYRTLNHFTRLAKIQFLQTIAIFLLVFSIPFGGFYGLCARAAIPALLGVCFYHFFRPLKIKLHFDLNAFKSVIKIGMPLCFWGTLESSLWLALESTLVLKLAGIKDLGLLSVAVVLRECLSFLTRSVHEVLMPRIVEIYSRDKSILKAAKRCIFFTILLVVLMIVLIPLISFCLDYFVPVLIPKYIDGIEIMKVILWMGVVQAAGLPLNVLFATGKAWLYGRGVLLGLVTFLVFSLLSSSYFGGMMAVVLGSLLGRIMRVLVCYCDIFFMARNESRGI